MTDAPADPPPAKPAFGVGEVLSASFRIYFSNFAYFFSVYFVPYFLLQLVFVLTGLGAMNPETFQAPMAETIAMTILSFALFALVQGVLARSAVTVQLGRGVEFQQAVRTTLGALIPITVLAFLVGIVTTAGFVLLFVPGLYLAAMFFVYVPAIVFENKGFSAIGRSMWLTHGYRWPIVGLLVAFIAMLLLAGLLVGAVILVIAMVGGGVGAAMAEPPGLAGGVFLALTDSLANSVATPLGMILAGLTFARLKTIREGGSADALVRVFE